MKDKIFMNKFRFAWHILTDRLCRNLLIDTLKFADRKCIEGGEGSCDTILFIAKYFHNNLTYWR